MSILDLSDRPAWYAVRVAIQRYGTNGYLGVRYRWAQPKYLSNMAALNYAIGLQPPASVKGGIQTYFDAELYQWNGTRWTKVA